MSAFQAQYILHLGGSSIGLGDYAAKSNLFAGLEVENLVSNGPNRLVGPVQQVECNLDIGQDLTGDIADVGGDIGDDLAGA